MADKPTGALDSKTGTEIINLLTELNKEGKTIVLITHEAEIESKLNNFLEISSDPTTLPYRIRNQAEMLSNLTSITETLTMLLSGIAAISLLVGGIGVMNIMLVSVTVGINIFQ